ncbi:unnamed protein product, partial [Ectocarpus sp. 12 AP-2014]
HTHDIPSTSPPEVPEFVFRPEHTNSPPYSIRDTTDETLRTCRNVKPKHIKTRPKIAHRQYPKIHNIQVTPGDLGNPAICQRRADHTVVTVPFTRPNESMSNTQRRHTLVIPITTSWIHTRMTPSPTDHPHQNTSKYTRMAGWLT